MTLETNSQLDPRRTRPVVGWFTNNLIDRQQVAFWQHLSQAAQDQGVDLICYCSDVETYAARVVQKGSRGPLDLARTAVDGLIVPDVALRYMPFLAEFLQEPAAAPAICVMSPLPGKPAVLLDNYSGVRQLMAHLIEIHHYRHIGFVGLNSQSYNDMERFHAYQTILAEYDLPFRSELVEPDRYHHSEQGYAHSVRLLLDERGLRLGVDLEALMCSNDWTAMHVIRALQGRGVRVPEDLAVVGCDDLEHERQVLPRLTSVHMPIEKLTARAVELILAQLRGEAVPDTVVFPFGTLVVRESCGCATIDQDAAGPTDLSGCERLAGLLETAIESGDEQDRRQFLNELGTCARATALGAGDPWTWQTLLSGWRVRPAAGQPRGHDLIDTARLLINEIIEQNETRRGFEKEQRWGMLQEIERWLAAATSEREIAERLAQLLPRLGIRRYAISLYVGPEAATGNARLLTAMNGDHVLILPEEYQQFPAQDLIPRGLGEKISTNLVVEPLYYQKEALGFMVIDAATLDQRHMGTMWDTLRGPLGGSIKSVQLYQQALTARQIAEQANELKSRFLSQVSHELYNPLSLIVGLSEDLLSDSDDQQPSLPTPYRQGLEAIRTTGQHLSFLVRDVLDLGRSQLGQLELAWEPVDLGKLLHTVAELGQQMALKKDLAWHAVIPNDLPLIWGDPTRLRQIVLNLLSNACKFTTFGEIALTAQVKDHQVMISVSDTGVGVPLHEQASIFDEFQQSERTTERGYGGMGLGLAITRRLVELHGGKISVQSSGEADAGAVFYFALPILEASVLEQGESSTQTQPVVVLSDQASRAQPIFTGLIRQGYQAEVVTLGDQTDWLQDLTTLRPGVIVLDCLAEDERPWQVLQNLKDQAELQGVPVLFFALSQATNTGGILALEVMPKPLSPQPLEQALQQKGLTDVALGRPTILVVDDEPAIRDLHMRRVQAQLPHAQVLAARDGREALECMQTKRPDLVLLDLMMPTLDGFGVVEAMQASDTLRNIPVIILTSKALTEDVMTRLNRGVTKVLQKGVYSLEETLVQIDAVLSKSKRLGSEPQRLARQAMAYLHEHYAEPLSRPAVARHIGVNEFYLTRCFHQETGLTPMDYLNRYRIKQARKLLEEGQRKITEVALAVGFSSSSQFSRVFHREVGVTPRDYQQGKRPA